jgi:hypothetical protein
VNARRQHLRPASAEADTLREEIDDIAAQLDRRHGDPPGTAVRAIFLWLWPPEDCHAADVLAALHAEAVGFLHSVVTRGTT